MAGAIVDGGEGSTAVEVGVDGVVAAGSNADAIVTVDVVVVMRLPVAVGIGVDGAAMLGRGVASAEILPVVLLALPGPNTSPTRVLVIVLVVGARVATAAVDTAATVEVVDASAGIRGAVVTGSFGRGVKGVRLAST